MSNHPFDLTKIHDGNQLRQKRRNILLRSIAPSVLILLIGLWFILPSILTAKAIHNYNQQRYKPARNWLTLVTLSSPQRFVAMFDAGTTDTKLKQYDRAEKELTTALSIAPSAQRCKTAQNLVFSLTAHAKDDPATADTYLNRSTAVEAAYPKCFKSSSRSQSSGGGNSAGGSSSSTNAQSLSTAQEQQLQQKNESGSQRQAHYAQFQVYNPDSPNVKPW